MNKKMKSIKVKIIMFLIPMLLISFIMLSGLGYKFASNSLKESNLNIMAEMTKIAAGKADDQIKSEIRNLEVIASNPTINNEKISLEEKIEILKPALKTMEQLNISISDKNGNSIDILGNKKTIKTTQSFMKSIKGENAITNPYVDPITNKKVIAYSVPIKDSKGDINGIITSIKDCKDFSTLNKEISFLKTGSSLIVDSNGNFIVAEDESLVSENKNITNMTSDEGSLNELNNIGKNMIIGDKSGIGKYIYEGKARYITYTSIGKTGLSMGISVEEKDLLSAVSSLAIVDTVTTIIMILLISALIIGLVIRIINRLLEAKTYVDSIAKGDFYTEIDNKYVKGNDEISEICTSIAEAKKSVKGMIKVVRNNANVVRDGSLSLTEIAEQLAVLTEEISASIGEVAISTNKESCDFQEISNKLVTFGNDINMVKDNVNLISCDVEIINNKSLEGANDIEQLNGGIASVNDSFERFATSIEYIHGDMKDVSEITSIINGISEQINLLSFNAAIEAASAGEAGKGFNVIALEVKKLSDKSRDSAQNINKIINRLMKIIKKLVEESDNMDNELKKQKNVVYNASSSFEEIAGLVKEITPKVSNINDLFDDIICNKDLIVETVSELSEEIKNTSSSLEQVTDSSVELAIFAEKVNNSSDVLLDKADDLIEKVKQFRIEKEDFNSEIALDLEESNFQELNLEDFEEINLNIPMSEELSITEGNLEKTEEPNYTRELDLLLQEELKELYMLSEERNSKDLAINEEMNLDLSLVENFVDLSVSPLEKLDADLPTRDFGVGCCKVSELKDYIKQKEMKEHEEEYEEMKNYNIPYIL